MTNRNNQTADRADKSEKTNKPDSRIFEQDCSTYLRHLGIDVHDGQGINCPYRPSSDSEAFFTTGQVYYDHSRGEGGNVWKLALNMKGGDKRGALESLYDSAGVPFLTNDYKRYGEKTLTLQEQAHQALRKVYDAFPIEPTTTPANVIQYLDSRKVSETTRPCFSYIPHGKLTDVLTEEEVELSGLKNREGLLILWYFSGGDPVYYCTRSIETKEFRKAFKENGILQHPIWNIDALYRDKDVVWGEGMFDCTSLMEIGYGVAGEITCHLISEHKPTLLTALRWRAKHHPDWTFTICLDNDKLTKDGKRPGNEAAEKMAVWLWNNGVDVKWVKHDAQAEMKVDINLLHQTGLETQIRKMIDDAKFVSEIIPYDEELCLRNFSQMLTQQDYRGASRVMGIMQTQNGNMKLSEIIKRTHTIPWKWQEVYSDAIKSIFVYGGDIYVIFEKERFGKNSKHYEVFKSTDFIRNMRKFQVNPNQQITVAQLDIEYRRPTWRVSRGRSDEQSNDEFNLFEPSPLLLQKVNEGNTNPPTGKGRREQDELFEFDDILPPPPPLPDIWNRVMDNLAGKEEKEWLLNHMATYVQKLEKPRTIPVIVGKQGTGKNVTMEFFGDGIGGYIAVDNSLIESEFNGYLMNAVVLLDELANNQRDSNQLKNRLKQLINEKQSINAKHRNVFSAELNNYVVIASNEQTSHVPLVIEKNDRRYCIISGGEDKNLEHTDWYDYHKMKEQLPDFMLYLLSRPIDIKKAASPLMTEKKQQLTDSAQDYKSACVRAFMEEMHETITGEQRIKLSTLCDQINEKYKPQFKYIPRAIRPILEDLGYAVVISHKQLEVVVSPIVDAIEAVDAVEADIIAGEKSVSVVSAVSAVQETMRSSVEKRTGGEHSEVQGDAFLDKLDNWDEHEG